MATAGTLVFAFNTKADAQADSLAERSGIPIENFNIIYKLTERIKEILEEKEPKIEVDEVVGTCKVLKIFSETKDARLIGARITSGSLEVGAEIRISKDEEEKGRGHIRELQQNKVGTDKISDGEFGAMIETRTEVSPGDTIEAINKVIK
jgi:translation initiation factor IF-2